MSQSSFDPNSAIEELAKQLPIKAAYEDGLSSSMQETGKALTDIIKVLRLALLPIQFGAALQDRYAKFLDHSIRRIPEGNRIRPAPQILGPALEGIRYEPEGTRIDQMFSQLLSRSMDKSRVSEAHPSFPHLIRQLSADEAQLLSKLNGTAFKHVYTKDIDVNNGTLKNAKVEKDELPTDILDFPANAAFYVEHLYSLGLAHVIQDGQQEPIVKDNTQTGVRVRQKYELTPMGRRFVTACTDTKV